MNVYKYFVVEMEGLYAYSKVATVGLQQWMDQFDILYTADNTGAFGVVKMATPDVLACSVSFFICLVKRSLRKLTTNIFNLSVLIFGVYLDVYLIFQKVTIVFFPYTR